MVVNIHRSHICWHVDDMLRCYVTMCWWYITCQTVQQHPIQYDISNFSHRHKNISQRKIKLTILIL